MQVSYPQDRRPASPDKACPMNHPYALGQKAAAQGHARIAPYPNDPIARDAWNMGYDNYAGAMRT